LIVPFTDTSPLAEALQLQVQRAMPDEQRLLLALEMSGFAHELTKERIRSEHPEWSDTRVIRELVREIFLPEQAPAPLR
jgi:Rv0078B-related antitoxin